LQRDELVQRWLRWAGVLTSVAAWGALALAAAVWFLLGWADYHWLGTLLAFGPRWVLLAAVVILAICAAFWRPRALVPLGLAGAVVAGPVMGLCVPMRAWWQGSTSRPMLRVLTCNTLVGRANGQLAALIAREQPDVVALQEWPADQPLPAPLAEDWHVVRDQGLVLASRWPITASEPLASPLGWKRTLGLRGQVELATGPTQVYVLHLSTPREGLEAVLAHGWDGLAVLEEVTAKREVEAAVVGEWLGKCSGSMVVAGDFNMTSESAIYRRHFGRLQNAFSAAGCGWGATKVTRFHSVRIDHVLGSAPWQFSRCKVGPDVGSDHRPVIADLEFRQAATAKSLSRDSQRTHDDS
jgi:vancomycin resistance protein VanJ